MTINERIKTLRKELGLTQQEFSQRIGIKRNTLSYIESDKSTVTDSNIKLICEKFNLNETWLRTGKGEREEITTDSIISDLVKRGMQPGLAAVVKAFLELEPDKQIAITNIIKRAAQKIYESESGATSFELTGNGVTVSRNVLVGEIMPTSEEEKFRQAHAILNEEARKKGVYPLPHTAS